MKHATSHALFTYWRSRQRDGGVRAGSLKAAELSPILPSLFLLDGLQWDAALSFCGAEIIGRYGRDLVGEPFTGLWTGADRDSVKAHLQGMAADGSGLVAGVMAETLGGGFICFELLVLPLAGASARSGAIGCMARVAGHEETQPVQARIVGQALRSVRLLPPAHSPAQPGALPLISRPRTAADGPRRYAHLTVIPGGRPERVPGSAGAYRTLTLIT